MKMANRPTIHEFHDFFPSHLSQFNIAWGIPVDAVRGTAFIETSLR
ncbi:MAG TPA: hypothetical protein QGG59_02605 [Planctomycetota bacterium]|nr:hypothetical protein [Planctomycetota bacterium]HJM38986.1 hypothetical protein [Planctomycetota bacterium]